MATTTAFVGCTASASAWTDGGSPDPNPGEHPPSSLASEHRPCRECQTTARTAFGPASSVVCVDCRRKDFQRRAAERDAESKNWAITLGLPRCTECGLFDRSAARTDDNPCGHCGLCQRELGKVAA